jgi:hypothetical protein
MGLVFIIYIKKYSRLDDYLVDCFSLIFGVCSPNRSLHLDDLHIWAAAWVIPGGWPLGKDWLSLHAVRRTYRSCRGGNGLINAG